MLSREWQPGDVAMVTLNSGREYIAEARGDFGDLQWYGAWNGFGVKVGHEIAACPLVVIDPEDREQVERLTKAIFVALPLADVPNHESRAPYWNEALPFAMQTALRSLLAPPKPEVYSHLVVDKADALKESVCGKVWRPDPDVTVLGKCPDCLSIANDEEWTA